MCKRHKTYVNGKENEVNFNAIKSEKDTTYLEVNNFVERTNEMNMD